MEEKRKTGIEIVGDVLWGTHFCQFYQNKEDLIDILIPYFNTGLKNNEFCMWVTSEPLDEEEVKKAMRKVLPDFDQYLRKGQIEIIPYTKWYLEGGTFDAQRVLHSWVDKLNQALAKGFDGLRLTGNTFWLEKKDWRKFTDYEEEVNNVTGKHRMIALCTYSLDKCEANEVIDVVSNHQFALIKQEGKWNLIESSEHKRTEETLRKAYDELEKRIQERTEELLKINKELQVKITDRKRAEEKLKAASLYARSLIEASIDPLVTISADGKVMDVNRATELVTGVPREQLIGSDFLDYFTEPEKAREGYRKVFAEESVRDYPLAIRHTSGRITEVLYNASVYKNDAGEIQGVFAAARDITERKEAENRIRSTNALLNLFSKKSIRKAYLNAVVDLIQSWSGCRCVGIRVLDKQGFIPYESFVGFTQEFWESENLLSIRRDQCACIRVITGNPDPQDVPMVTHGGSFHCDNTFKFVGTLSEEEKARFRGVCIQNGFLSVSIVPIRFREEVLGAIHLADEREGQVLFKAMEFIESVAPLIGEALNRFNLEEELRESENRLRLLSSQLLTVQENERKRVAREIHDGIGQMLTAIKFKVEDTIQQKGKGNAKIREKSLETIIPLIQGSVEEVRRIQMDLRPSTLDDLGILATIDWFCREFGKIYSTIHIEKLINIHENEVPALLKTVIFRVMQEALNNIAKHSKADLVHLSLKKKDDRIELVVEDNGTGFDLETSKRGLGLTSMKERIEYAGGSFFIQSVSGKGTTIRAILPI